MAYQYTCRDCGEKTVLDVKIARNSSSLCPHCKKKTLTYKDINTHYDPNAGSSFVEPKKHKAGPVVRSTIQGRSNAAPTITSWPLQNPNQNVTHVWSLQSIDWINAGPDKICLTYELLDPSRPGKEGILIHCPQKKGKPNVLAHFEKIKSMLENPLKKTDPAEATGEAAAALCILSGSSIPDLDTGGFNLEWGLHVHSGAGIDQIWKCTTTGSGYKEYLIVEAKGPGQQTADSRMGAPPDFAQMGIRWIMHNLETMCGQGHEIAIDIVRDLDLQMGKRWPTYGGASKSYYGAMDIKIGAAAADLYGVVITAVWKSDGMLHYHVSDFTKYTNTRNFALY